jgi:hypothetical protein
MNARAERGADRAAVEHALELADRRLPPPVFVHEVRDAGPPAGVRHPLGLRQRTGHRLLADDRLPVGRGQVHELRVGADVDDDVHHVDRFRPQQLLRVVVHGRDAKLVRQLLGLAAGAVVEGGDLHAGQLAPAGDLEPRPEAAAEDRNSQGT